MKRAPRPLSFFARSTSCFAITHAHTITHTHTITLTITLTRALSLFLSTLIFSHFLAHTAASEPGPFFSFLDVRHFLVSHIEYEYRWMY